MIHIKKVKYYIFILLLITLTNNKMLVQAQSLIETRVVNISAQVGEIFNPGIIGSGGTSQIEIIIPPIVTIPEINEEDLIVTDERDPIFCEIKADLNCDKQVDLIDFSILVFWFSKPVFPKHIDIVSDGTIDLRDFSSLAFYWNEN